MKGSHPDPFELRAGETDRVFFIYANMLASGDTLASITSIEGDGITEAGAAINSTPLTYDGVEYAANTVAYVDVSGIAQGDKVELVSTVVTTAGRTLKDSMWIKGVSNYSGI